MTRYRTKSHLGPPQSFECGKYRQRSKSGSTWNQWPDWTIVRENSGSWTTYRKNDERIFCTDEVHKGPPYTDGGVLDIKRLADPSFTLVSPGLYHNDYGTSWQAEYLGGFYYKFSPPVSLYTTDFNSALWDSHFLLDIASDGAKGWKMYQPIKPTVDLGQTAYEIRELPRMLHTTAKGFSDLWRNMGGWKTEFGPKSVADHWLNLQFGWSPFLNDMGKLFAFQQKLANKYRFLANHNGKWTRRGGTVTDTTSILLDSSTADSNCIGPNLSSMLFSTTGVGNKTRTIDHIDRRTWFEALFRFWIPHLEPYSDWKKDYTSHLGLNISPSLLYNLTPWTWLLDWFTNVGDVIDNASTIDQVVAKYAYIMGHTQWVRSITATRPYGAGKSLVCSWDFPMERKQRIKANPFGFGLNFDQLSNIQLSILGALGLSRTNLNRI